MYSPCSRQASQAFFHGCCQNPCLVALPEPIRPTSKSPSTTAAASRYDFTTFTRSSFFPNTQFTNHESLLSLPEAFSNFTKAYPHYSQTEQADSIRAHDYYHLSLSNRVCLDYIGLGLFSYSQQQALAPTAPNSSEFPFFCISFKLASLKSQLLYGGEESELESMIRDRIMSFLNISQTDYRMVFTTNRASAFKLLAESYPFRSNRELLTVYDYESEGVGAMIDSSQKQGARVRTAEFSWPSLRIHSAKLRKMVVGKRKKRKRGLFVFPLQSKMTGARYSYLWMRMAQENGWHVLLDACAVGPKEMDTFGLSLFRPDFIICSFFKVFGENPSGFGCLFVKRTSASVLEASTMEGSIGIVSLVPVKKPFDSFGNDSETQQASKLGLQEDDLTASSSFSGPLSVQMSNEIGEKSSSSNRIRQFEGVELGEASELYEAEVSVRQKEVYSSEIVEVENPPDSMKHGSKETSTTDMDNKSSEIECKCLDHADSLGLILLTRRARYLINWLVNALMKLRHPNSEEGLPLVKIYGPRIKFVRGPAVAFNVFDWKGEKIEPMLVQKLADRSNISLSYGFLQNIWFSEKYEEEKERVLEKRTHEAEGVAGNKRKDKANLGIMVVTASLGFLANFEDTYRLWSFIAQFLDADFVEKEHWSKSLKEFVRHCDVSFLFSAPRYLLIKVNHLARRSR